MRLGRRLRPPFFFCARTISIFNNFSNVLPGDIAGAGGIRFITSSR
jgi:hypothetical protein